MNARSQRPFAVVFAVASKRLENQRGESQNWNIRPTQRRTAMPRKSIFRMGITGKFAPQTLRSWSFRSFEFRSHFPPYTSIRCIHFPLTALMPSFWHRQLQPIRFRENSKKMAAYFRYCLQIWYHFPRLQLKVETVTTRFCGGVQLVVDENKTWNATREIRKRLFLSSARQNDTGQNFKDE